MFIDFYSQYNYVYMCIHCDLSNLWLSIIDETGTINTLIPSKNDHTGQRPKNTMLHMETISIFV